MFVLVEEQVGDNNQVIKYYESSLLQKDGLTHAFTTRIGPGMGEYGFTLGTGRNPALDDIVSTNRKKIVNALSLDGKKTVIPKQEHTNNVKVISNLSESLELTDGVITDNPKIVLMLQFADCTPIILYAPDKKVIGVVHAGWKGTAGRIVCNAVKKFEENFNIKPVNILAGIGPTIGQCCYPVANDVYSKLKNSVNISSCQAFKIFDNDDKIHVDLKMINQLQLQEVGVENIDVSKFCTSCDNDLFFSYRAENGKTGRHSAIASIEGQK